MVSFFLKKIKFFDQNNKFFKKKKIEREDIRVHFDSFDKDGDGHITVTEIATVIKSIGETATSEEIKKYVAEVDKDKNGTIEFDEFCDVILLFF